MNMVQVYTAVLCWGIFRQAVWPREQSRICSLVFCSCADVRLCLTMSLDLSLSSSFLLPSSAFAQRLHPCG